MWAVEQVSETVSRMRISYVANKEWEFRILITSDRHVDSKHSDLGLQKKHLDIAKKMNWPIVDLGDMMDAMQGRKDPRSSRLDLRSCLGEKEEYFDSVVDYTSLFLANYAKQFALIGLGNHETSIMRHNETNLVKRVVKRLNAEGGNIVLGAYAGWIKLLFESEGGRGRRSINVRYIHGSGGAAPVTKGVLKTGRRGVVYPDANIVLSGHTHEAFVFPITRERLSEQGRVYKDEQLHVQIPSYKDETTGRAQGFGVEKEFSPKPEGAYWLKFWFQRDGHLIRYDAERAF